MLYHHLFCYSGKSTTWDSLPNIYLLIQIGSRSISGFLKSFKAGVPTPSLWPGAGLWPIGKQAPQVVAKVPVKLHLCKQLVHIQNHPLSPPLPPVCRTGKVGDLFFKAGLLIWVPTFKSQILRFYFLIFRFGYFLNIQNSVTFQSTTQIHSWQLCESGTVVVWLIIKELQERNIDCFHKISGRLALTNGCYHG